MTRRKRSEKPLSQTPVPAFLAARARPPLAVVLGSPAEVVNLLAGLPGVPAVCYQMDLHQADRLRADLTEREVDWMARHEWALTADDVLWRRSKLGLKVAPGEKELLARFMVQSAS